MGKLGKILTASILSLVVGQANARAIYFTNANTGGDPDFLSSINLDGSNYQSLLPRGPGSPVANQSALAVAVDDINGKLYSVKAGSNIIQTNLDGTGFVDVDFGGRVSGSDIEIDVTANTIFFSDGDGLYTSALTTNSRTIISLHYASRGIGLDTVSGHVYYAGRNDDIWRVNYDGSDATQILDLSANNVDIWDIDFDSNAKELFIAYRDLGAVDIARIQKYTASGDLLQDLFSSSAPSGTPQLNIRQIYFDSLQNQIYWTANQNNTGIYKANSDGTGFQQVYSGDGELWGIALGPTTPPISPVPLPATAWLFISALGGLVVAKRRKA